MHSPITVIRDQAVDTLLISEAEFQSELTRFSTEFTKHERAQIDQFSTKLVSGFSFLQHYFLHIQPIIDTIQSAASNTKFTRELTNQLHLKDDEVRHYIGDLTTQRAREIIAKTVREFYQLSPKQQTSKRIRAMEQALLTEHDSLETSYQHSLHFFSYAELASACNVPYVDSQASYLKRRRMQRRVNRHNERMASARYQDYQHTMRKRLIEVVYGDVLQGLLQYDWNIATVLALRNKYKKALKTAQRGDDTYEQLLVAQKVSKDFVADETKRLSPDASLSQQCATQANIQALLVKIFSLSTVQKNSLLLLVKEYKRYL